MIWALLILGIDLAAYGENLAYVGIAVFLMLTGAGLPIPEEVFIIAAGALSAQGTLKTPLALLACLVGALAGDCILYWIGYHFGLRVVREHHWWTRFVHPEREAQMERMIHAHGLKVLFLTRFLVGIRAPVYLSAGVLRVPFRRFFLYDLFCASMVIGTFFGLSYFLTDQYGEMIYDWIHEVELWLTAVVVLAVAVAGIILWRRHRRKQAGAEPAPPQHRCEGPDRSEEQTDQPGDPGEDESFDPAEVDPAEVDPADVEPASGRS